MSYTTTLVGLPYISFSSDTPNTERVKTLEKALVEHPEDELEIVRFIIAFGTEIEEKRQLCLEATDRLFELAEDDEDRMEALIRKAEMLCYDRTDLDTAEKLLIEAYTIDPHYQQPYKNLAAIYIDRKEYAKALHWGNLALEQKSFKHIGLQLKANALLGLKRIDEAIELFQTVIDMDCNPYEAHFGLAQCLIIKKQYQQALTECLAAFEKCHYPEPAYSHGAGYCYQCLDDPYRAMKWYTKTLDIEPSFPDALNNMAIVLHDLNNGWQEGLPYLLKAAELSEESTDPSMKFVYHNLWVYYTEILDRQQANYYLRLILKCAGLDDNHIDFLTMFDDDYDDDDL